MKRKSNEGSVSFGNKGIIEVCTRVWWREKSPEGMGQALVHEMGHQAGMVPGESASTGLDKGKHHYLGRGHVGNHLCKLRKKVSEKISFGFSNEIFRVRPTAGILFSDLTRDS